VANRHADAQPGRGKNDDQSLSMGFMAYGGKPMKPERSRKEPFHCLGRSHPLFIAGREVTANPAECFRTLHSPKTSSYLLLPFRHADISFALFIGRGCDRIMQKSERFSFEITKALHEISKFSNQIFGDVKIRQALKVFIQKNGVPESRMHLSLVE
jgi:hypothetical protein